MSMLQQVVLPPSGTTGVFTEATVDGKVLPITGFSTTLGAYGSVGHCSITTSRKALDAAGIDLINRTVRGDGPLPITIYAGYSQASRSAIFVGHYDDTDWDFLSDRVTIHGRDLAGALVDQKFILTKNYANQTADQLVTQIANQFGFTPVVTPAPPGPDGKVLPIGVTLGYGTSFMTYQRPVWDLLQALAHAVGYLLYITPQKQMVFAPPIEDDSPLPFSWNILPPDGVVPLLDLKCVYAPRRNKTFSVVVLSHHHGQAQLTQGTAVVAGEPIQIPGIQTIKAGVYVGAAGTHVRSLASSVLNGQPFYPYWAEGKTAQDCQTDAGAIARDIAKHEIRVEGVCDGLSGLRLLQSMQLQGDVGGFIGRKLYVNSITHNYRMPSAGEHGMSGFTTEFSALSIPPTSISDPSVLGS